MENVEKNTSASTLKRIDQATMKNIETYSKSPELIAKRIRELETEWDIERVLELNASIFGLLGLILAVTLNPFWLIFSGLILAFLSLHAFQGWCPPLPLFRSKGKRTRAEIDEEMYALKVIRGDFRFFHGIHEVYDAVKKH